MKDTLQMVTIIVLVISNYLSITRCIKLQKQIDSKNIK